MVQLSRPAKLRDIPLRRLLSNPHPFRRLKISRAVESVRQGRQQSLSAALRTLLPALSEAPLRPAWQALKHRGRVSQQHLHHRHGRLEVRIIADQQSLLPFLLVIADRQRQAAVVHLAKHRQNHRDSEEDQPQATHRGDDVVAEQRRIFLLRLRKKGVEPALLLPLQAETDGLRVYQLMELVEVPAYLLEKIVGSQPVRRVEHVVPNHLRRHHVEDEAAEKPVLCRRYQVEHLLRRARQDGRELRLHDFHILAVLLPKV